MRKRKKHIIIILITVLTINLVFCSISYIKFRTCNYFRVATGLIYIYSGNADYVVIRNRPNQVILALPKNSEEIFNEYLGNEGYILKENERLGALRVISKDGKDEVVSFSLNGYYSMWIWYND